MKSKFILGSVLLLTTLSLLAQAERIKGKAKVLKRNVESQQTNSISVNTNSPARR